MDKSRINTYLRLLEKELRSRGLFSPDTIAEVESHLLDARDQGLQNGLDPQAAQARALDQFGSARLVARRFESERKSMKQKLLLVAHNRTFPADRQWLCWAVGAKAAVDLRAGGWPVAPAFVHPHQA
jgi:hypothetical protein